jgi:hypothetical protein
MAISKQALIEALGKLNMKYRGKNGVTNVTFQMTGGQPTFAMQGPSKLPPPGLPGGIKVLDAMGVSVVIPVLWFQNAVRPLESQKDSRPTMWDGPPAPLDQRKVEDNNRDLLQRPVEEFFPAETPRIITAGDVPKTDTINIQAHIDVTGPLTWWTKSFDVLGCLCCTFYDQPALILQYQVPQDYALVVDGWALFVPDNLAVGEIFEVSFIRDGDTLLTYEEVVIDPANPDPALRCLFSGSVEQRSMSYLRIDRNQTLTVVITPKGAFPFNKPPMSSFCGTICVLLHGHRLSLMDNRDGGPRPKDVGEIRDLFDPSDVINSVTKEELQWITQTLDGSAQIDT